MTMTLVRWVTRLALVASSCWSLVPPVLPRTHLARRASTVVYGGKISVSLEKPLGLVLEEMDEKTPKGVVIAEILEEGSAAKNDDVEEGLMVAEIQGTDYSSATFEEVMEAIQKASSPVELVLKSDYVLLKVVDQQTTFVTVRSGDNLRKALLAAGSKLYDFKGSLTNCNGAGQCATCVVDIDDDAFGPRSDWEATKLKNRPPTHRLSCQTLVPDDLESATITLKPPAK